MANFFWIPQPDKEWDVFLDSLSKKYTAADRGRIIVRNPGDPEIHHTTPRGTFADINTHDTLIIPAHGSPDTTEIIGWKGAGGTVTWRYDDLAKAIARSLGIQKARAINYELWACWAGDNHHLREAFGGKFASACGALGMRGQVIAYRGKVTIGATDQVWIKGTGRFTSWFGKSQRAFTLNEASKKGTNIRNFYQGDHKDVRVVWLIPT